METESQEKYILAWLQEGNAITPIEALFRFGSFRLSARIYDLRLRGHKIKTEIIKSEKSGKRIAKYYLDKC